MKFSGYLFLFFLTFCCNFLHANDISAIRSSAEKGDSISMFQLGNYYFYGLEDVKQNFTLAAYWYQRAANAGVVRFHHRQCQRHRRRRVKCVAAADVVPTKVCFCRTLAEQGLFV